MKIGKWYSLGQSPKIAAHAVEWRRVLSLARSIGAYRGTVWKCVKIWKLVSDKKKRVQSRACALTGRTTYDKIPLERTTRLARSCSPTVRPSVRPSVRRPTAHAPGLRASFYPEGFKIFSHAVIKRLCVALYSRNHGSVQRRCPSSSKREGKRTSCP